MSFFGKEKNSGSLEIPKQELNNLAILSKGLKKIDKVTLYLVGGALTKPWPRKDIDVAVVYERDPNGVSRENKSHYQFCSDDYQALLETVEKFLQSNKSWSIVNTIEPERDYEFGNQDSILRHDGSVVLQPNHGTPIELVHILSRGTTNFERSSSSAYQKI